MKFISLIIPLAAVIGCSKPEAKPEIKNPANEYQVASLNWFQTSGEYRALCYQSFNTARLMFDQALTKKLKKKPAVIVDIDETVLDNSPYQANQVITSEVFPKGWKEWTGSAKAHAIPGAVEFLNYAGTKGADVFYITNRKSDESPGTIQNLRAAGFPFSDSIHVIFRTAESSKELRRLAVMKDHEVVLLCGDNLNDFTEGFERKSIRERFESVEKFKAEFGKKFIVMPNPLYGEWEGAIYGYDFSMPSARKDSARKSVLRRE